MTPTIRTPADLGLGAPPWIVGHRGVAGEAPENSLDSLLLAVDQGADMVELDLQLTSDGKLVASHDWTLERMGGIDRTIEESLFEEIREVEISGEFRQPDEERVLASLDDILARLPAGMPLNLELKRQSADRERFAGQLVATSGDRARLLISSFDWDLLAIVRRHLPAAAVAPLGGRHTDPAELLAAADRLDAWSIHCRDSLVDADLLAAAGAMGRPVLAYTVNQATAARRLFARGVQGVFSDFPGRLRRQLADLDEPARVSRQG